jgi:uncharacterized protein YodC (DUF2158 family)
MATKFAKGQEVKVKAVIPAGPVEALRMDEDGNFFYQVKWADENGVSQTRWFEESELVDG